jgi:hypothetical protein
MGRLRRISAETPVLLCRDKSHRDDGPLHMALHNVEEQARQQRGVFRRDAPSQRSGISDADGEKEEGEAQHFSRAILNEWVHGRARGVTWAASCPLPHPGPGPFGLGGGGFILSGRGRRGTFVLHAYGVWFNVDAAAGQGLPPVCRGGAALSSARRAIYLQNALVSRRI